MAFRWFQLLGFVAAWGKTACRVLEWKFGVDFHNLLEYCNLWIFLRKELGDMLGINEHKVIVTGKFAATVRKAAKASFVAYSKRVSPKQDSEKTKYHFDWKWWFNLWRVVWKRSTKYHNYKLWTSEVFFLWNTVIGWLYPFWIGSVFKESLLQDVCCFN